MESMKYALKIFSSQENCHALSKCYCTTEVIFGIRGISTFMKSGVSILPSFCNSIHKFRKLVRYQYRPKTSVENIH